MGDHHCVHRVSNVFPVSTKKMSDEKSGGAWFSTSLKSNWVVNKHQWRKATPPVDVFSWHTIIGGLFGYATQVDRMNPLFDISREVDRLPKNAAMHRKLTILHVGMNDITLESSNIASTTPWREKTSSQSEGLHYSVILRYFTIGNLSDDQLQFFS